MSIEEKVWLCLEKAIDRFNESGDPATLLCPRRVPPESQADRWAGSERAISYRLAFYLESELRGLGLVGEHGPLVVDCEYNRHVGAGKNLEGSEARIKQIVFDARRRELEANEDGFYVFTVAPDIVVHQRRTDVNNLLVVEVKKRSNHEPEEYDALKLELFTTPKVGQSGYGYKLGAWIVAEDEWEPDKRRLLIDKRYKDGRARDCTRE